MNDIDYASKHVLIIDDQPFIRKIVATVLRTIGFKILEEASDGAGGLEIARSSRPDIILCDIEMEPIDGLVFLQTLRQDPELDANDTPVIFLTQHSESDIVEKARKLGVDSFVIKPPTVDALKRRIDFILSRQDA